jgi:phage host-nuclease inhibitor protein Gam
MTPVKHVETTPSLTSWDGADRALGEIRALEAQIAEAEGSKALGLKVVQDRWDAKIQPLNERVGILAKGLQEFAEFHREDMGAARSKALNHGRLGFRVGKPMLKPLPKWTFERVLELLQQNHKDEFTRTEQTIRKDAILNSTMTADQLKDLGLRRVQEDRFFYEIKDDSTVPVEKS